MRVVRKQSGVAKLIGVGGVCASVFAAGMGLGCATYANYPRIESAVAVDDVNIAPVPELMRRALTEVIGRDIRSGGLGEFSGGRWVVNFPEGMERGRAIRVVDAIGTTLLSQSGGIVGSEPSGAVAMYSVTRVWVRGDEALVEVIRPSLGGGVAVDRYGRPLEVDGEGGTGFQRLEVRLRTGFKPWTVTSVRAWTPGLAPEPTVFGWPDGGASGQAEGAGAIEGEVGGDESENESEVQIEEAV